LGALIAASLAIYFSLSLYFFPPFYISQPLASKAAPVITNVELSTSHVPVGKSFDMLVRSINRGDTAADVQIVSISFPNLTGSLAPDNNNGDILMIKNHNFTQNPMFVDTGDDIGFRYSGGSETITAKYPSVEFFSRPWKADASYQAQIELKPDSLGRFVIFVKAVSLPHIDQFSHYPQRGIKDYQEEFVEAHSINVERRVRVS